MAKFNFKKVTKNGEYGTISMTIRALINALRADKVLVPKEQRDVKDTGVAYRKKRDAFLAHVLTHAFTESDISDEVKATLQETFGNDIEIHNGTVQFVGISVDADGYVYLSDGQHRFLHYLADFFSGVAKLKPEADYGNDFLNRAMDDLFDRIEMEDGEGSRDKLVIDIDVFDEEALDRIYSQRVLAQFVKAKDEEERAALFVAMNTGTQPTQADLDKANFGKENMYQAIAEVHKNLDSTKIGEPVTFDNGKTYSVEDTKVLKILFNAPIRTLVPIVAHACLLTYLNKKTIGANYQWERGYAQTQAEQVRNFFKATHNMSPEECNKVLFKIMDDVVMIGKALYNGNTGLMTSVRGMKSLMVGQLHAVHNKPQGMPKAAFFGIAKNITLSLVVGKNYLPAGSAEDATPYDGAYFNNGHRLRNKNELFAQWVAAEYAAMEVL